MRHLLNPLDFSVEETDRLLVLAKDIEENLPKYSHVCDGKKLATLFYEPSTRTRLSFEAAMLNLGAAYWAFLLLTPVLLPKAKVLLIQFGLFHATQISVL
jgi:aspartate carbamoyltransferase catalytic subunit